MTNIAMGGRGSGKMQRSINFACDFAKTESMMKMVIVTTDITKPELAALAFIMLIRDMKGIEFLEMVKDERKLYNMFNPDDMPMIITFKDSVKRRKDIVVKSNFMENALKPGSYRPMIERGVIPGIYKPKHKYKR